MKKNKKNEKWKMKNEKKQKKWKKINHKYIRVIFFPLFVNLLDKLYWLLVFIFLRGDKLLIVLDKREFKFNLKFLRFLIFLIFFIFFDL